MVTQLQKNRIFRSLERMDPKFIEKVMPFLDGLYKHYFRCGIEGFENVPEGQALFVGNHNGLLTFEVLMLFYAWWDKYGSTKRALGLAHAVALDNPVFSWLLPRLGAIPAHPEIALEAVKRGFSLMVYPGGEKEAFRAYSARKQVEFYNRKGFIKLALNAKMPIVPIVSIGAQESYIILDRGEEIAERLGLKDKFRLHGVPVTFRSVFFLWCVATGVFTFFPLLLAPAAFASIFVPLPAKMDFRILPAIDVAAMMDPKKSEEENLQIIYDHIVGAMQTTLTKEYEKRKYPIVG
jgi:1-acyl-sn-glycerol-3-phosphate acyltransferase